MNSAGLIALAGAGLIFASQYTPISSQLIDSNGIANMGVILTLASVIIALVEATNPGRKL